MKCPNCNKEMKKFGVNERGEYKYHCPYCYCQAEGDRVTRTKVKINFN